MTRMSVVAAVLVALTAPAGASAATYTVTTTADDGAGSLRQAIIAAQAGGPDEIAFGPGGRGTINITSAQLPVLATDTTVTGTRTDGVPDVELHCAFAGPGTGLQAAAGQTGVVITGLSITHCTNGVFALANSELALRGSWIGRSRTGTTDGNTSNGLGAIGGAKLVVGGPAAGDGNVFAGTGATAIAAADPAAGTVIRGNTITGSGQSGLALTNAAGAVIQDNVVSGNTENGIKLTRGTGAVIRGNRIGTDAAGATAVPNGFQGVNLLGTVDATVGGAGAGEGNVIAAAPGAGHCGVAVQYDGDLPSTRTVIAGNRVGTTASGLAALTPAGFSGICVLKAVDTTIGGTTPGSGNLVGGFANTGIGTESGGTGTVIQGNVVGLRADGGGPLRNEIGIGIDANSAGPVIGGTAGGARNVVSGNGEGIYAAGPGTRIEGNLVGLAPDGRTVVGNVQGIVLDRAADGLRVGNGTPAGANVISGNGDTGVLLRGTVGAVVAGNVIGRTADGAESRPNGFYGGVWLDTGKGGVIGGDAPGDANLIDGGLFPSIRVEGADQLGTRLLGNLLRGTPASVGIDLLPPAQTANDPGDADAGPNGLQNAPVLTAARANGVDGTVATKASTPVRVQLFSASADGRETYALLGDTTVTTDGAGNAAFTFPLAAAVGDSLVATATTDDGTSELSAPVRVSAPQPPPPPPPVFGLSKPRFSVAGTRLRVRLSNKTTAAARVRVGAKDAKRKLKTVTKTVRAGRTTTFELRLPASTQRRLAKALRRKKKVSFRPTVSVKNLTSGVAKTYKPKITVKRPKKKRP